MNIALRRAHLAVATAALLATLTAGASTVTLNLTDTVTNTGSPTTPAYSLTASGLSANAAFTGAVSLGVADGFNGLPGSGVTNLNTAADFGTNANGSCTASCGGPWNFQDEFLFTTSSAAAQAAVIALGTSASGMSDLQVRIIQATNGIGGATVNAAGVVGSPAGGTVVDGWTTVTPVSGVVISTTLKTPIPAGSFYLQVRGEATGAASYGGTVTLTPVPVPGALALFSGGLGLLGFAARRRSR